MLTDLVSKSTLCWQYYRATLPRIGPGGFASGGSEAALEPLARQLLRSPSLVGTAQDASDLAPPVLGRFAPPLAARSPARCPRAARAVAEAPAERPAAVFSHRRRIARAAANG